MFPFLFQQFILWYRNSFYSESTSSVSYRSQPDLTSLTCKVTLSQRIEALFIIFYIILITENAMIGVKVNITKLQVDVHLLVLYYTI